MTTTFAALLKKPNDLLKIYKSLVDNPKAYFELINTKEKLEASLLAVASMAFLGVIPSFFTPQFTVMGLFLGTAFLVAFTLIGCGILHLIRGLLKAEGNITEYVSFTAWMQFLFFPAVLTVSFVSHLSGFFLFNTLVSAVMIGLWFYAFHRKFRSDLTATAVLAVVMLAFTVLPSLFTGGFSHKDYSKDALEAQNPEFAKRMKALEDMQEKLREAKEKHQNQ